MKMGNVNPFGLLLGGDPSLRRACTADGRRSWKVAAMLCTAAAACSHSVAFDVAAAANCRARRTPGDERQHAARRYTVLLATHVAGHLLDGKAVRASEAAAFQSALGEAAIRRSEACNPNPGPHPHPHPGPHPDPDPNPDPDFNP